MPNTNDTYLISSYLEMRSLLRAVQTQGTLLRMHTTNHALALVTTLLEIDDDTQSIIVDNSSEEAFNRRLVQANSISFETTLDKVRIVFTTAGAQACLHQQRPAFRLPFPENMERVQRREFYRVDAPAIMPPLVAFTLPNGRNHNLAIKDISAGGLSVIDDAKVLDNTIGTMYRNCTISLPDNRQLTTDLQIKRSDDITLSNGRKACIVGCQFINLPSPMHIQVQNYIGRLERKMNARTRGFD
ncbi:flagellar brake protein [Alcaligenaceae bacterium]|nr:flagellar brake protein [Alcaligenaceae bacterium]